MSSTTIQNIRTPLAEEYLEQKKLVSRNNKSVSSPRLAQPKTLPEDVVTLSSEQPDDDNAPRKLKPSQPVSFEEKRALRLIFSVRA